MQQSEKMYYKWIIIHDMTFTLLTSLGLFNSGNVSLMYWSTCMAAAASSSVTLLAKVTTSLPLGGTWFFCWLISDVSENYEYKNEYGYIRMI